MSREIRIEQNSLGLYDSDYSIEIDITSFEPFQGMDFLHFKNLQDFIQYLMEHGKELLETMDECDVEIIFKGKDWSTGFDEKTARIAIEIKDIMNEELKRCHRKLEKIRKVLHETEKEEGE